MTTAALQPLATWPAADRRAIQGVLTDIDDTLTTDGAITPDALDALHRLRAAGLQLVAVTGRPIGWSEPFARQCPLDAVVAENGAVAWVRADAVSSQIGPEAAPILPGQLSKLYQQPADERLANHARMQAVLARIEREVPGARRATDSAGRECDIAIDHSEFAQLDTAQIDAVVALMRAEGLHATVSSIHVNGWIGDHDKWQGACWIVRALWRRDLAAERDRWCYVGDSTNDERMFAAFGSSSVGVANIARFVPRLQTLPRYATRAERGAGFAEVAEALLAARAA